MPEAGSGGLICVQRHRVPHFAAKPTNVIWQNQNHEPRRRASLAFACLVCRPLRSGDLGAIFLASITFSGFDSMDNRTERVSPPISHARTNADGLWYVTVTWRNGRQEQLGPYKTEAFAQEIIKAQLAAWHEGQKLFRKPPQ